MNVSYRELPGMSQTWLDFLAGFSRDFPLLLEESAELKNRERLDFSQFFIQENDEWCSARTTENIQRLQRPDAVAVVATVYASVLGGDASQILKCLTAIKASEELERRAIPAVPVCRIVPESAENRSVALLDDEGELHRFSEGSADLISRIEELGHGTFDPGIIQFLRSAYSPDATLSVASARIFSGLMKEWGLVALIGAERLFSKKPGMRFLFIVGPYDVQAFSAELPAAWPAISATVTDPRSRKTLEKYNIRIGELFAGENEVMNKIQSGLPGSAALSGLKSEVEQSMAELGNLVSAGNEFVKIKNSCKEKIVYQIEKLQNSFESAISRRLQAAGRQVHRACNLLAPNGCIQERELAGIYFPLRYSRAVLRRFYEQLDGRVLDHQLITMD
jgi:uncharacterized protein YllA (UPF0747 family)